MRYLAAPLTLLALLPASAAGAKVTAKPRLETTATATRIVVTVRSTKPFTARTRPRSVAVKAGGTAYALRRARTTRSIATAAAAQRWVSRDYTGAAAAALSSYAGQRVAVVIRSRAGKLTLRAPLTGAAAPSPPTIGPGPTPTPTPPPQAPDNRTRFVSILTGSGWNDPCVGQSCGNDLMVFCADGRFLDRFTSGNTGYDYHYTGTWQLASEVGQGHVLGYNVVEARVVADTTDQFGAAKRFEWVVDLSENYPSGLFGGQEFGKVAQQGC